MSEPKKQFEQKDLTGVLFKNAYKNKDSQPDMTGTATIDGVEYKIAGWSKTSAKGTRFLSLNFQNKDDAYPLGTGKPKEETPSAEQVRKDMDDNIPW